MNKKDEKKEELREALLNKIHEVSEHLSFVAGSISTTRFKRQEKSGLKISFEIWNGTPKTIKNSIPKSIEEIGVQLEEYKELFCNEEDKMSERERQFYNREDDF